MTVIDEPGLAGVIDAVLDDPDGYYLNLRSAAYPAGAIRGQLPDGGQALIPATDNGTVTAVDVTAGTYGFQVDGAAEALTVTYADTDTFTVNGQPADVDRFEAAAEAEDAVAFSGGARDGLVHRLIDTDAAPPNS